MKSKRTLALSMSIVAACSIVTAPACRTSSALAPGEESSALHAECVVCKHEGDLACVDVTIAADTPRSAHDGVTYYFCSQEFRSDLEKHPAEYLGPRR